MKGEPFIGGGRAGFADFGGVVGFFLLEDIVDVLNAEGFAGAENGGGVVRIVDVFEDDTEILTAQRLEAGNLG